MNTSTEQSWSGAATLAGKYMTFKLSAEEFGVEILRVRELIGLMEITRVPQVPEFVRGVINLRGKVIPIVDLRMKFGMGETPRTSQTVIIVVQIGGASGPINVGILVDEVLEVRHLAAEELEPPPEVATRMSEVVLAVGKTDRRVIFLLDINHALTSADKAAVAKSAA